MLSFWLIGILLVLVQAAAALPWLLALEGELAREQVRRPAAWAYALGGLAVAGMALGQFLHLVQAPERLDFAGRVYAFILQVQLTIDALIAVLGLLPLVWRKGGAVLSASFREGVRQPLFWTVAGVGLFLVVLYLFIPYFTFGDDLKFMKLMGFDTAMLAPALFGVLAAGLSITEDIEGRTAITLLSKPVSRRQYLLGKYGGILLAALAMTALLGWALQWTIYFKPILEPFEDPRDPLVSQLEPWLAGLGGAGPLAPFVQGAGHWFVSALAVALGLAIGFCQGMILTAVAAALATRLPMLVNLVTCLLLYFLGHLAPVLLEVSTRLQSRFAEEHAGETSVPLGLVHFMAQLFDYLLPALQFFNLGPAVIRDRPLPLDAYALYVGTVVLYSLLYTALALLLGLILLEDRDLA